MSSIKLKSAKENISTSIGESKGGTGAVKRNKYLRAIIQEKLSFRFLTHGWQYKNNKPG